MKTFLQSAFLNDRKCPGKLREALKKMSYKSGRTAGILILDEIWAYAYNTI
jgi:hypothetical protein